MLQARFTRLGAPMAALVAIVALLLLADLVYAAVIVSRQASVQLAPAAAPASPTANPKTKPADKTKGVHPCNHGFYVSQAAHAKKGGGYVSGIAQSDLGKDGNCSAPLPAEPPARAPKASAS